jgi:hypothetical protein
MSVRSLVLVTASSKTIPLSDLAMLLGADVAA